ncbi:pre-B-cell leukemia transcription factor-interacting protein 1 isoform X1 [Sturnira hondurensis]|uniref:pre-B-cell leukemia transcription factor-interacting protein 1 isoform X1 n=2 Tax=Sturnira hondurensis TaxID=192404 RepID=UPI00187AC21E|nr:pre-B-cell leukemia transcription factor-interacting protein 1 isoform X1 [Sturnira hondurensis]
MWFPKVAAPATSGTSATMASCPDSDNSWMLAGSESLPVETLGPESGMGPVPLRAPEALRGSSKADVEELAGTLDGEETPCQSESSQSGPVLPEETAAKGALEGDSHGVECPGSGDTVAQGDLEETPVAAELGQETQDLEDQSSERSLPSSRKAAWIREEAHCTSSEDDTDMDVEGLRRRRGREPSTPQPSLPLDVEDEARGQGVSGELGLSLNMCLLGALVLLGLGILLFSGGLSELESGPVEEVELQVFPDATVDSEVLHAVGEGQDGLRQQLQASAPPDSVPSLQNMALLLDKLAKENQDIHLLQAQLQAQKEELRSLMHQPKGLEEENAQLRGALQQGKAFQRALESELQQLRARLQGLEADCIRGTDGVCLSSGRGSQGGKVTKEQGPGGQGTGFLEQKEQLEAEAQALRQELERQRQLLGSVQQDLERSLRDAGQGDPVHPGLAELGHRLAQKLQGLGNWGQDTGVPANASEAWHQEPHFQGSRERSGKEKWQDGQQDRKAGHWKHKKEESGWERKKSWRGEEDTELAGRWKESKPRAEESGKKDGKRQSPKEPLRKSGSLHSSGEKQKHPQWKEGAKDRHGPQPFWAELLRHKYRAPQGCSGVHECARQEGLALFGMELAPVRQQEMASLLRTYLARLPWAGQLTEELPLSPAYFGEDGIFRHDRLRFRDFVDALEDSLEEVAVRQTGDDDEVDDFEDFIFSHFFGDKALKKRSGKKDKHWRSPRVVGPREERSHHRRG